MLTQLKDSLWKQFGASIEMLEEAITRWPEDLWFSEKKFFYLSYHTIVFLDYYLTIPAPENFSSRLPFTYAEANKIPEEAIDDVIPDKIYSKQELLRYLNTCKRKCQTLINELDSEKINLRFIEGSGQMDYPILEILLYNMRHVQHHAAQLNMLLRQRIGDAPRWVGRTKENL